MKIEVMATDEWSLGTQEAADNFINRFPVLKDYKVKAERVEHTNCNYGKVVTIVYYEIYIELNTLEELLSLQKAIDEELVIKQRDGKVEIEIYNDYRE